MDYLNNFSLEISTNITSISAPTLKIIIRFERYVCWEIYWWLIRITLVVAFGFLPQNFSEVVRTYILSFLFEKDCNFSGADNMRWW